jgi:hypothetical protein
LGVERKLGGNLHPWLNIGERSIANKYPEGKLKSTSKGELKDLKSLRGKRVAVIPSFDVWGLTVSNSVLAKLLIELTNRKVPYRTG